MLHIVIKKHCCLKLKFNSIEQIKMFIIRRNYYSGRLPKIAKPESIGKILSPTYRSCPKRNHLLGENFCRFAVKMNLYINATNEVKQEIDTHVLHQQYEEAIRRLDLREANIDESNRINLSKVAEFLPRSICTSLEKWKKNAHDEIRSLQSEDVPDDIIAERVRACNFSLIGWYLQNYGMQNAFSFMRWLGISNPETSQYPKTPLKMQLDDRTQRKLNQLLYGYNKLEQKLQYQFQNKALLLQSVSHSSFTSNDLTPSNRGLDFAGDAILNYVIVRHLFRQKIYLNAYDLENVSSLLQCNSSYATISIRNNFHKYLRYTTPTIRDNINKLVAFLRHNKFKPITDFYFVDQKNFIVEVPPIIPNSLEALVGAAFLDSKMDLNVVANIVSNLMHWDIQTLSNMKPKSAYVELRELDPKAVFSEPITIAPGQIKVTVVLPKFNDKTFVGISRDQQLARWAASKNAVIELKSQTNSYIPVTQKELLEHYSKIQATDTSRGNNASG